MAESELQVDASLYTEPGLVAGCLCEEGWLGQAQHVGRRLTGRSLEVGTLPGIHGRRWAQGRGAARSTAPQQHCDQSRGAVAKVLWSLTRTALF